MFIDFYPRIIKKETLALLLKKGKKFKIKKVWSLLKWLNCQQKKKRELTPFYFEEAISRAIVKGRPDFTVKTKRKGKSGLTIIPKLIHPDNQLRVSHRWLAKFILRTHFTETLKGRLNSGLEDVLKNNISEIIKKKIETNTRAFDNRTFAHYRWWKGV